MEKLPTDIVENILCRLSMKKALPAKRVCTTWRDFLRSKTDEVSLLFAVSYPKDKKKHKLYYGDHSREEYSFNYHALDSIESMYTFEYILNFIMQVDMPRPCKSLVCCESRSNHNFVEPFLICKKLTGEVGFVPQTRYTAKKFHMSGFGYCQSTNEYKIARIYLGYKEPKKYSLYPQYRPETEKYHVQVYTVGGTGGWRYKESINFQKRTKKQDIEISPVYSTGIYANGAIHWLHKRISYLGSVNYTIASFDLEDEDFQFIQLPILKDAKYEHRLKLLGGNNLYFVYTKPFRSEIWAYKRKITNIPNACDMNENNFPQEKMKKKKKENYNDKDSWQWIKEFTIEWEEPYREDMWSFDFLAITRKDELLLRCQNNTLYCYDFKTSTLNKVFDGCLMCCSMINVILAQSASFQCR